LAKRWPAEQYQALATQLAVRNIAAVIVGAEAEKGLAAAIPGGIDLIGRTSFGDLADLARGARFAVGNDTGPMHLIAATGCPTITLFSNSSNPSQCAPLGRWTRILQQPNLADLAVETVIKELPD
jgi:ADP-heptose:LPS heptosyltransferase